MNYDGHQYIDQAIELGANAIVVDKKSQYKREKYKHSGAATYEFGGQIHFSYKGMKKRVIFAMDGYAGQQEIIDMDI